jgi:hypothetical protein
MTARLSIVAAAMLAAAPAPAADVKELDFPPGVIGGYAFDRVIMMSGTFENGVEALGSSSPDNCLQFCKPASASHLVTQPYSARHPLTIAASRR